MPTDSSYCIEILNCFNTLNEALIYLKEAVCENDAKLPGWLQPTQKFNLPLKKSAREKAMALLSQVEYLNNQESREILIGPGIFAASSKTLNTIEKVNECKNRFKQAILTLK